MKQDVNIDFLKAILNNIPDALLLIDKDLKLRFSNSSFDVLFNENENSDFDQLLGESIKCKDFDHDSTIQPHKCKHCKLRQSVKEAFNAKQSQLSDSIVLQIKRNGSEIIKLIQYQANYMSFDNNNYVLLKLNDFSELGQEAYDLLTKLKKDI